MLKKIGKKRRQRIDSGLSELNTFRIVHERSKSISELSGEYVYEARVWCFAHILAKGMYPELRNDPNNIIFVKNIAEHELVDHFVAHNKKVFFDLVKEGKAIPKLRRLYRKYNENLVGSSYKQNGTKQNI